MGKTEKELEEEMKGCFRRLGGGIFGGLELLRVIVGSLALLAAIGYAIQICRADNHFIPL